MTKLFLVDTTSWIYFFRKTQDKHTANTQKTINWCLKNGHVVTSGLVLAEVIQGLGRTKREIKIRRTLENLEYLPVSKNIYIKAGELSGKLSQKGLKTPLSDCLLAAICLTYDVILVTDDLHFKRFRTLKAKFI